MSVRSRSNTKSGCCKRQASLDVGNITQQVEGGFLGSDYYLGDPSTPIQPSGLDGPFPRPLVSIKDGSEDCQKKIRKIIVSYLRNSMYVGFYRWLRTSRQSSSIRGLGTNIRFTMFNDWDFEVECCEEEETARVITPLDEMPKMYGVHIARNSGPEYLRPPIKGA
jgi:hypothetical protein